jgi:hypothetical protein
VTNNGIITSPRGEVVLAAGNRVELVNPGTPNLRVEVAAPDNAAVNLGTISAEAGRIGIYAGLIGQRGRISADSVVVGEKGQVLLRASGGVELRHGSTTSAGGASGGSVEIAGGSVIIGGEVRADGDTGGAITVDAAGVVAQGGTLSATGGEGDGGSIRVAGRDVFQTFYSRTDASSGVGGGGSIVMAASPVDGTLLTSGTLAATGSVGGEIRMLGHSVNLLHASADAGGRSGGGAILVGGDYQGSNPAVPNARDVAVNGSTVLLADAGASSRATAA